MKQDLKKRINNTAIELPAMEKDKLYRIHSIDEHSTYAGKLKKMGFIKDTVISLAGASIPDPFIVKIRDSRIALRIKEARILKVRNDR